MMKTFLLHKSTRDQFKLNVDFRDRTNIVYSLQHVQSMMQLWPRGLEWSFSDEKVACAIPALTSASCSWAKHLQAADAYIDRDISS